MRRLKWSVLILFSCAIVVACSKAAIPASPPKLSARMSFVCKWWSEEQMNGLDPNNPPPQNTEVVIQKWDFSDPVGTPHPDVVELVVEVKNESNAPISAVSVEIEGQWKTGPFWQEKLAKWMAPTKLKSIEISSLPGHGSESVRFPINVAAKSAELKNSKGWPYSFRGKATILVSGSTLASTEAELPILKAD